MADEMTSTADKELVERGRATSQVLLRNGYNSNGTLIADLTSRLESLLAEVERLRTENTRLQDELDDIESRALDLDTLD